MCLLSLTATQVTLSITYESGVEYEWKFKQFAVGFPF